MSTTLYLATAGPCPSNHDGGKSHKCWDRGTMHCGEGKGTSWFWPWCWQRSSWLWCPWGWVKVMSGPWSEGHVDGGMEGAAWQTQRASKLREWLGNKKLGAVVGGEGSWWGLQRQADQSRLGALEAELLRCSTKARRPQITCFIFVSLSNTI